MDNNLHEVYGDVQKAIDYDFNGQFVLKFYDYLKVRGTKRIHKQLREGYGHIPKPQARKIRNYLYGILEDAWKYSHDKRPGRRKKQTK